MLAETSDPICCLDQYPDIFRKSLESENRLCLSSFIAAEYDDLLEVVKKEVQTFADVNVAWLSVICLRTLQSLITRGSSFGVQARGCDTLLFWRWRFGLKKPPAPTKWLSGVCF